MAAIAPTAAAVVHVGRSRQWIQPALELPYTPAVRWVLRHIPLAQALHRLVVFLGAEWDYPLQTMTAFGAWRRRAKMRQVAAYMRRRAPPQYHAMLVPDFPISCKVRPDPLLSRISPPYRVRSCPVLTRHITPIPSLYIRVHTLECTH